MVKRKKDRTLTIGIFIIIVVVALIFISQLDEKESFTTSPFFFKINIGFGGDSTSILKITNNEDQVQSFKLSFKNLERIAFLSEEEFSLDAGESKEVSVSFSDFSYDEKVYVGQLVVESSKSTKEIPIALGVESDRKIFAIVQEPTPSSQNVYPGGELRMEIRLSNLKDFNQHGVSVNYIIRSFNEGFIVVPTDVITIESKHDFLKIIDIPKNAEKGSYVLVTSIDYEGSRSVSTEFFEIERRDRKISFEGINYFYLMIFIIVIGAFWAFYYFFSSRDRFELQLARIHRDELKNNLKVMIKYRKELEKIRDISKRKAKLTKFDKEKRKVVAQIKGKQKKQVQEFLGLKKKKKRNELERKLYSWKRQGYKMFELKKGIKHIPRNYVSGQVEKWRREGYNVSMLRK